MSLNDIIEYINLAKYGNNTYQERKNLLINLSKYYQKNVEFTIYDRESKLSN